ncbi:hypothetical protein BBF96_15550 [Anoxybacter fermentans]|uniref:Uncharacterized protein n=1 Tax=Anoxybacter fermentans TaxID=1323375 RepID=A0A3S9T297_9FIRM|nr:hypothetical protein [Anoxybacter fermentans]AZR74663.1 hypothetical protein BBF96_15550 [Anoxybacter fermentans]
MKQCIQIALENHPDVIVAQNEIMEAQLKYEEVTCGSVNDQSPYQIQKLKQEIDDKKSALNLKNINNYKCIYNLL